MTHRDDPPIREMPPYLNERFLRWHHEAVMRWSRGAPVEPPDSEVVEWCRLCCPVRLQIIATHTRSEPDPGLTNRQRFQARNQRRAPAAVGHLDRVDRWKAEKATEVARRASGGGR